MYNSPEQLKTLKHVKLDPNRKADMRAKLSEYADLRPLPQAAQSTTSTGSQWWLSPAPVLALLVLMFVGTGSFGVLAAAKQSLPGDQLYAVKTNVYEPMQRWLADTPAEIAAVALEQSQERNREIAALEKTGTLSDNVKETLERRRDRTLEQAEIQSTIVARTDPVAAEDIDRQIAALSPADPEPEEPEPIVVAVAPKPVISTDTRPLPATSTPTTSDPLPTTTKPIIVEKETAPEPTTPTITLNQVHERIRETLNDTLESLAAIQTKLQEIHLGQSDADSGNTTTSTIEQKVDIEESDSQPSRSGGSNNSNNVDAVITTPETVKPVDETPDDTDDNTDVATSTNETTEPEPSSNTDETETDEPEPPSTSIDRVQPIATSTVSASR